MRRELGKSISEMLVREIGRARRSVVLTLFLFCSVSVVSRDAAAQSIPSGVSVSPRGVCAKLFVADRFLGLGKAGEYVMLQRTSFARRTVCRFDATVLPVQSGAVKVGAPGSFRAVQEVSGSGTFSFTLSFPKRSLRARSPYIVTVSFVSKSEPSQGAEMVSPLLQLPAHDSGCFDAVKVIQVEEVRQRSCQTDADCSASTIPFGCGCHYAKPLRRGGDPRRFFTLLEQTRALGCTVNDMTPCDCAEITGVVCNRGVCDWRLG
jgi:hypothetical protein